MSSPRQRVSKRHRPHVPLDKRKRAIRACISCRDSKKKCVLTSANQCRECTRYGLKCNFEPVPKDRSKEILEESPKHNQFAVWDEVAMDVSRSVQERFPGINLNAEQFSIISNLFKEAIGRKGPSLIPVTEGSGRGLPTALIQDSQSRVDAEPQPIGPLARAVVHDRPSTSHASFLAAVSETISPIHRRGHDEAVHMSSLAQEEDASLLIAIIDQLPPHEVSEALVNVFFTFLESNWYYFDEQWFRAILAELYTDEASAHRSQCTTICLVLLVLALGSTFEHLFKPFQLLDTDQEIPGSWFFVQATRLMPRVIAANSVESAICCLLTSLYLLATEDIAHHHTYLGLALNLAIGLSLHRMKTDKDETPQSHEMKVRLFWTIYSIERQTSVIMGLPAMLQVKDITAPLPQRRQDLDPDGSQRVDRLIVFTKLTMGMDEIINAGPVEQNTATYEWACSKLESLREVVPAGQLGSQISSFRADVHLQVMYNMIWVNIGRGATLRLVRRRVQPEAAGSRTPEIEETYLRSQKLAEQSRQAATVVIDWIGQLHGRNLLARFSFTDFHTCSAAVIVLLLHCVLRSDHPSSFISQGIDALRFMAEGSKLAMNALQLIERLQKAIQKSIGVSVSGDIFGRQPSPQVPLGQALPQSRALDLAGDVPYVAPTDNIAYNTSDSTVAPIDLSLFPDLNPWLQEYSDQYLALFGFDGFGSSFDPTFAQLWDQGDQGGSIENPSIENT